MFYIIFLRLIATSLFGNDDAKKRGTFGGKKSGPFFLFEVPILIVRVPNEPVVFFVEIVTFFLDFGFSLLR